MSARLHIVRLLTQEQADERYVNEGEAPSEVDFVAVFEAALRE
ncbi:hypothetical protein [Microbacterium sp. SLBN-146]|nr:hypothetical protein [Microbacterium sp. SLBN-146]TQJ31955.1 hypothetical protein FBY39_2444 [Microbacterium sp. SLBN-146]